MIPVSRPYMPDPAKLSRYIEKMCDRRWITNGGPLVQSLTERLADYLGVENILLVNNGTLALQVAYRTLGLTGTQEEEAVTTPFTFVATASSLKWEGVRPVFADISPKTWCLDPVEVEKVVTPKTRALVPVHVFGNGCCVEAMASIAARHRIVLIYDGAHAFGVRHGDRSLLSYGDATTISFHATKLFHTVEGGAVVFRRREDLEIAKHLINFGLDGNGIPDYLGINAKMNEMQAAVGLCILDDIEWILEERAAIWDQYHRSFSGCLQLQEWNPDCTNNYSYFPVAFDSEKQLLDVVMALKSKDVLPRRYFYPSLDEVSVFGANIPRYHSRDISKRILCLPLYAGLEKKYVKMICGAVGRVLR